MRVRAVAIVILLLAVVAMPLAPRPARAAGTLQTYMSSLDWPIALAFSPDGRIFFAEKFTGNIRVIDGGVLLSTPFLTLAGTATSQEQGLLGLALHPDFPGTPYVYAYHTFLNATDGTTYNRVVRALASGNTGTLDRVVLDRIPAAVVHNGGIIGFGPDGKLYVVDGDATNLAAVQDIGRMHGKTFRLEPDGSVPSDNPFVGVPNANPYVYTFGHRNVFGLAFHPTTGRAFVTENGPACNDEVNLLEAGRNYGWGPTQSCATPPPPPQNTNRDGPNPVLPLWYTGPPMLAPTNAAVYSGASFPSLQGHLLVGDWNTRSVRRLELEAPGYDRVLSASVLVTLPNGVLDVESGPDDAIWITTSTTIFRYVDTAQPPTASFTASPSRASPGVTVTFNASASSDPDGTIVSYAWDFGDGATGTGVVATHAYASPGVYDVVLTVVDNESFSDTASRQVFVNAPPQAVFSVVPLQGYIGTVFAFDASASFDPDGAIATYAWNFGDGTSATGAQASHAFAAKGGYAVVLTVTDGDGATGTATRVVVVGNRAPRITAHDPGTAVVEAATPANETFAVTAEDPDGDPLTYTWSVGGAVVPGADGPGFAFRTSVPGTYVVNVTVSDGLLADWREWRVEVSGPDGSWLVPWIALLAAALGVLAVLVLALWWRRRRRR